MKKLTFLTILSIIILISSCTSVSIYLPAVTGNDIAYLPKPMASDSIKTKNYVSGGIAGLTLPYSTGNLDMGFVNFSRAHTFENLNIAYGAFGYAGLTSYYNNNTKNTTATATADFDGKGFIGGGLRSSIGFYDASGNTEFRIISWENVLSFEGGGYADFRKKMNALQHPDIVSSTKTTLFTTGGATEIIFHAKKKYANQYALKAFYGFTPGLKNSLQTPYNDYSTRGGAFNFSFYFKLNKFFGILDAGTNRGFSSKFSLGYAF